MVSLTSLPALKVAISARNCAKEVTFLPFTAVIISPDLIPALSAPESFKTSLTKAPEFSL